MMMKSAYMREIRPTKEVIYRQAVQSICSLNKFDTQEGEAEKGAKFQEKEED